MKTNEKPARWRARNSRRRRQMETEFYGDGDGEKGDGDGEYEAAKKTPMRRLRGALSVDSDDAEVAERQKRMKETDGDRDGKEMEEEARNLRIEGDVGSEESKIESDKGKRNRLYERYLDWKKRKVLEEEEEWKRNPERLTDPYAFEARLFRQRWDEIYLKNHGSFDKNTNIPCKRFTHNPPPDGGIDAETLQVLYVKVGGITGGLQRPLEVFGLVALRDSLDCNRNIIFQRDRDKCQMLTDENPYLELTGPVRAVMICGRVIFEASLYVKGATISDDKELSLLAPSLGQFSYCPSRFIKRSYRSRLSTLELMLGQFTCSVEATIEVRLTSWSWPDGFRCRFEALAGSTEHSIVLLETTDDHVPINGDDISLARQVVSVDLLEELIIVSSTTNGYVVYTDKVVFQAQKVGSSSMGLGIGGSMLEVTVYWSCFPFALV